MIFFGWHAPRKTFDDPVLLHCFSASEAPKNVDNSIFQPASHDYLTHEYSTPRTHVSKRSKAISANFHVDRYPCVMTTGSTWGLACRARRGPGPCVVMARGSECAPRWVAVELLDSWIKYSRWWFGEGEVFIDLWLHEWLLHCKHLCNAHWNQVFWWYVAMG
jgi:hypothetical protein